MKRFTLYFISFLSVAFAQAQLNKSRAYKTGIYLFCGAEIPKRFSYIVERKMARDTSWKVVAELKAAGSEADCERSLLSLPPTIASFTNIQESEIKKLWTKIQSAQILDSLQYFAVDPRYQRVAGCVLFDQEIAAAGVYQYRVSKMDRSGRKTLLKEENISFPDNSYHGKLTARKFKPGEQNIRIVYGVEDSINTAGIKLFRTKYEEKNFAEVPSHALFTREDNKLVVQVTDAGTIQGITYTYVAVPVDALGNEGVAADTLNIYNVVKASDIALIEGFNATPKEKERGNLLDWKLKTDKGIGSIDVYRSQTYEGNYQKIASLSLKETKYFDNRNITPSKAYYYYILVNNGYGTNLPSARVPVILKGAAANLFPPQNLTAIKKGNVVELRFLKLEPDTRGYYIYRSTGYRGKMKQLQRMLLTTDSALIYIDTLPGNNMPMVYSYAVADINTSYNISPQSERVSIQTSGDLPIPLNVTAVYKDRNVFITWKDVAVFNSSVTGYQLYKAIANAEGKETEPIRMIAATQGANSYVDSVIDEGVRYHYYVQSIGLDSTELSSLSTNATISVPEQLPLQPGMVTCFAAQNKIVIKWEPPADQDLKKIRIYRALSGQRAKVITELRAGEKEYEDKEAEVNKDYFYYITSVNGKNRESRPTDAVSAKIRK